MKQINKEKLNHLQAFLQKKGLTKSIERHWKNQKKAREKAEEKDAVKPVFLKASDIAGEYDTSKALLTTLGGQKRIITKDDLKVFSQNIKALQQHYMAGITARQVIDLSLPIDIDRANKQIKYALPRSRKDDVVSFVTDASGENGAKQHFVNVQFMGFNALKLMPDDINQKSIQKMVRTGGLRFECDCGRYQYWYRYLNTIAGTCLGRQETGYPKIRNPNLSGVACKHILRTMKWVISPQGAFYLEKELEKARHKDIERRQSLKKSEVKEHLASQLLVANDGRKSKIHSPNEQKRQKQYQKLKAKADRMAKHIKQTQTKRQRVTQHQLKQQEQQVITLFKKPGYTILR